MDGVALIVKSGGGEVVSIEFYVCNGTVVEGKIPAKGKI